MATLFAPLQSEVDNPTQTTTFPSLSTAQQKQPTLEQPKINTDIVPRSYLTNQAIAGSEVSTLQQVLAWIAAAKGDFRGLVGIDEAKRKTALGKSLSPHMLEISSLINKGKFDDATKYLDEVAGSYGPRATEIIPYLNEMRQRIASKQSLLLDAKARVGVLDEITPQDHPNRPIINALKRSLDRNELMTEQGVNNFFNKMQLHTQQIDNRVTVTQPLNLQTASTTLPAVTKDTDVKDYIGVKVAGDNRITEQQLADVLNGVAVKDSTGKTITPNSPEATKIRTEYTALLPLRAQGILADKVQIPPELQLQFIKESGLFNTAYKIFGTTTVDNMFLADQERKRQLAEAPVLAQQKSPFQGPGAGYGIVNLDDTNPSTFLVEAAPTSYVDVQKSGGKLGFVRQDIIDNEIKPARTGIQQLQQIPALFEGMTGDLTQGSRLSAGAADRISRYLGYPVTHDVELRQIARSILDRSIEAAYNIRGLRKMDNQDNAEIAAMKRFAAGNFRTVEEYIDAAKLLEYQLGQVIRRAVPVENPTLPVTPQKTAPSQRQGNVQRNRSTSPITEEQRQQVLNNEQETINILRKRYGTSGGQGTVTTPGARPPLIDRSGTTTPVPTEPSVPSAADRIKQGWKGK